MSAHIFTYGSLMCADIMRAASGGLPESAPARLSDFSRHPVAGEDYPGIRHNPGHSVAGLLYLDVPPQQLARLDVFEGVQYAREEVSVTLDDGRSQTAFAYVFKPDFLHLLEPGEWDFDAFLSAGHGRFRARYAGFGAD